MYDDNSNDVEAVQYIDSHSDEGDDECRPIMLLLRRLINHKQNTVMTNAQIINILHKEFDINIGSIHELEVDIYIKIIKKYLKDWPQWEELERISTKLSNIKDFDAVNKVLNHKYKNLKEYLGVMLEAAKPLARNAVAKVEAASSSKNTKPSTITEETTDSTDTDDVVMEVQCTRTQLNHLFFRRPRLDLNTSVFNNAIIEPSRISLKELPVEAILQVWAVKIAINLPFLTLVREVIYDLKHTLVNFARKDHVLQDIALDTALLMKNQNKYVEESTEKVSYYLDFTLTQLSENEDVKKTITSLFNILKNELAFLPQTIQIPAMFKRFANHYKYVRYLYVENNDNSDPRYDLQLEEVLSPMYFYSIAKISSGLPKGYKMPALSEWMQIECMMCRNKFSSAGGLKASIEQHFIVQHHDETDWQCTHCKRLFSFDYLAKTKWQHEC